MLTLDKGFQRDSPESVCKTLASTAICGSNLETQHLTGLT
jgi:hypothetical protein